MGNDQEEFGYLTENYVDDFPLFLCLSSQFGIKWWTNGRNRVEKKE